MTKIWSSLYSFAENLILILVLIPKRDKYIKYSLNVNELIISNNIVISRGLSIQSNLQENIYVYAYP